MNKSTLKHVLEWHVHVCRCFMLCSAIASLSICSSVEKDENQHSCGLLRQLFVSSSVSVEVSKKGFHREVITTVDFGPDALSGVKVLLVYRWPRNVYVDPYQLASLSSQSDWQILLDSSIDLEAPAHKASSFVTYVYPSYAGPPPSPLTVTVPVHVRYHEPSFVGETFTSVDIQAPDLLLWMNQCTHLNGFEPDAVVDAPCTVKNSTTCQWYKIQHQQEYDRIRFQLPVGDGSLVTSVCVGTLLITITCCGVLSKYMWKHRII